MVWIKDIWVYFLDESDIEKAYLDYYSESVIFEKNEYCIEIPRLFKRIQLLREFIEICGDKQLMRISEKLSDSRLRDLYHGEYSCNYEPDNMYSQWIPYAKGKIFDYAENWCLLNNFKCSKKEENSEGKYVYLDCL